MKRIFFLLLVILVLMQSCQNPRKNRFNGAWTFDRIIQDKKELLLPNDTNVISFKFEPIRFNYAYYDSKNVLHYITAKGNWSSNRESITIQSNISALNGKYKVIYYTENQHEFIILDGKRMFFRLVKIEFGI